MPQMPPPWLRAWFKYLRGTIRDFLDQPKFAVGKWLPYLGCILWQKKLYNTSNLCRKHFNYAGSMDTLNLFHVLQWKLFKNYKLKYHNKGEWIFIW